MFSEYDDKQKCAGSGPMNWWIFLTQKEELLVLY